ncbi:MAG: 3-deoxy-D-manno-octulosonate 8-phosphate phosphatase [Muribaculaceae bacterium]|nr:3-deoxy-D-manno-octulosonate 8-phosphate phosphatase [Muribaculaceae bacterium]
MSGINYDLKKIKGIVFDVDGVLSPSTVPMSEDGQPMRMVNIKDGYALQLAARYNFPIAIITGGKTTSITERYKALGIKDIYIGASVKLPILKEWMVMHNLATDEVAYMGDDIPDLQCLKHVGLPCCPQDAACEVKDSSIYISPYTGGYGCARDILRQILIIHGMWMADNKAFGW